MILNTIVVAIIALICYFILPLIILMFIKDEKTVKKITLALFCFYIIILLIGVWADVQVTREFVKISLDFSHGLASEEIRWLFGKLKPFDIMVNLVMLMPIGMTMVILKNNGWNKLLLKGLLLGFIAGLIIELGQFILPVERAIQTSDVLFNTISVVLGTIVGKFYLYIASSRNK